MGGSSDDDTLDQDARRGDHEKAERGESGGPGEKDLSPVGFWHRDLRATWIDVLKNWAVTSENNLEILPPKVLTYRQLSFSVPSF